MLVACATRQGRCTAGSMLGFAHRWLHAFTIAGCALMVLWSRVSATETEHAPCAECARRMALGFNVDLFPTVISAVNGKLGYAPQVWIGIDRVRVRFVGAHLEAPDAFAFADEGFENPTTTAFAAIIDYTFGPHFDGPWIGSGFEIWQQSIRSEE